MSLRLLYIHQYFKIPSEGGSLRSYYLAKELVKIGHEVIMITAHNHTHRISKTLDGIEVIYLPVSYSNYMSLPRRGLAFLKFMILAMFESMRYRNIDCCYVMTTPLSTGVVALFNKYFLRRPYIFEVGDLWPKVPIDMGLISSSWKQKLLEWAERAFYKKAGGLVGLSEPITQHLTKVAPNVPAETIFNISDCEQFKPSKKNDLWVEKFKVIDKFVVSYTGTFGRANDLGRVIAWANSAKDLPIHFLLVGDGVEKKKVNTQIENCGLTNITTYGSMSKTEIKQIINISDAMLVSFANVESLHTGSPNKFFDALAAGKLVITNFGGWAGDLIKTENCGFVAETPLHFRERIAGFLNDETLLKTYQENARKLAEYRFELSAQSKKQEDFILKILS